MFPTVPIYRGEQSGTVGNKAYRGEHYILWGTLYTVGTIKILRRQVPWGTLYTVDNTRYTVGNTLYTVGNVMHVPWVTVPHSIRVIAPTVYT